MKIKRVECTNFKCFDHEVFDLSDDTRIEGENFQGKTSIAEAVVFAIYGSNLSGSTIGIDEYLKKGEREAEVALTVEIGDKTHEIVRTKGESNAVYVDGRKTTNAHVAGLVGEKEEFLSVFSPGYFASLGNDDARALIVGLVPEPTKEEVLERLTPSEEILLQHEPLRDPEGWAKVLREELRDAQKEQQRARGQIELLTPLAAKEPPVFRHFSEKELDLLIVQRDFGEHEEEIEEIEDRLEFISKYDAYLFRRHVDFLDKVQATPEFHYQVGDECPTCKAPFTADSVEQAIRVHENRVEEITKANEELKRRAKIEAEQRKKWTDQVPDLKKELQRKKEAQKCLETRIAELQIAKREAEQHNAGVKSELKRLEADRAALDEAKRRLDDAVQEETETKWKLAALTQYRARAAQIQIAQLQKRLDKVSIQLFQVVASTGEIKPTFELLYEGREYRTLSYSERVRANLEIANLINEGRGFDWPVFIDNAESVTHYSRPAATQVITSHVVKGAKLTVNGKEVRS